MNRYIIIFLCSCIGSGITGQPLPDSVRILYNKAKTNSDKGECLIPYLFSLENDSLIFKTVLELNSYFKNKNDLVAQDYIQLPVIGKLAITGDFATALNQSLQILSRCEDRQDSYGVMQAYLQIASALFYSGDIEQSITYSKKVIPMALLAGNKRLLVISINQIATAYSKINMPDSGLIYAQQLVNYAYETNNQEKISEALGTLAENYIAKKEYDTAISIIRKSLLFAKTSGFSNNVDLIWALNDLAQIFLATNQHDSARNYARQAAELAGGSGIKDQLLNAYEYLYKSYEKTGTKDSVYKYFRLAINTKDSLFTSKKTKEIQALNFREQLRQQEIEQDKIQLQNKIRTYALLAGLAMFSIIAIILYRNNRQKQKANKILETTLTNLKATQSQLIHSEKMASLGELTAGIAHEIQNPLNFVNNFSEVNREMIEELLSEKSKVRSERDEQLEVDILNDIKANEEKINHHGKRADAIVKGMLQHSKASTGKKEPTDLNALCDEYLRLAYHGLRAKDKSFNADFKTDFDESIGKINVVAQDIGRVLLNLYNNAFYVVNEKFTAHRSPLTDNYKPLVSVQTKRINSPSGDGGIEISVSDNGNGIPQNIVDKIFQPFFTTKPTGQGTGLGLSLSYDIIKAHGGEIKVETKDGKGLPGEQTGSEFVIVLPL